MQNYTIIRVPASAQTKCYAKRQSITYFRQIVTPPNSNTLFYNRVKMTCNNLSAAPSAP